MLPILVLLLPAQPAAAEAPLVGRPAQHFYGAVGERVSVTLLARVPRFQEVYELRVEEPLTLTVTIHGATNPEHIDRPDLKQLPEFASRFYIEDLPDGDAKPGERSFRYRLRPKSEQVDAIPPLLFHYYNPRLKFFATTASQQLIMLHVSAREPSAAGVPMQEPEFLFEMAPKEELFAAPFPETAIPILFGLALILPPAACQLWYLWWKRRRPDAARVAILRKSRAVRHALDALERLNECPAARVADRITSIATTYLHERIGLPRNVVGSREITAYLGGTAVSPSVIAHAEEFFDQCDAARFGPAADRGDELQSAARRFVVAVEEST